jgi:hypothetical protein
MTLERLKQLYRYYNRRYWNGELPDYQIRFGRLPGEKLLWQYPQFRAQLRLGTAQIERATREIWFDPRRMKDSSDRLWRIVLMHEMAHIRSRRGHGGTFFTELCRCPNYVVLHECGNDIQTFRFVKYGRRSR